MSYYSHRHPEEFTRDMGTSFSQSDCDLSRDELLKAQIADMRERISVAECRGVDTTKLRKGLDDLLDELEIYNTERSE